LEKGDARFDEMNLDSSPSELAAKPRVAIGNCILQGNIKSELSGSRAAAAETQSIFPREAGTLLKPLSTNHQTSQKTG
jgi:hypothetical protein